jgi:signal transduction histidine kinase
VEQVILNLVRNGLEAMGDTEKSHRELTVRTGVVDDEVHVSVADRGPGLSADALQRVFQPFFTTKSHGMGLGLSISRSIIDAHGGRLWAVNQPGGGAVFQFSLPLVRGDVHEHRTDCVRC